MCKKEQEVRWWDCIPLRKKGVIRSWLELLGMKADNEGVSVPVLGWEACCLA